MSNSIRPEQLAAVNQGGYALDFASDDLQSDRGVVLAAVNQNGFASDELKSDRDVVFAAASQCLDAIRYSLLPEEEYDEIIDEIKTPLTKFAARAETPNSDATLVATFSPVFHSVSVAKEPPAAAQAFEEQSAAKKRRTS